MREFGKKNIYVSTDRTINSIPNQKRVEKYPLDRKLNAIPNGCFEIGKR